MSDSPARKPWWRRWFGSRAERAAARYLRKLGWSILRRNWSCPHGEIDVIAADGACVVFIEVRSTGHGSAARPAASVDAGKQARLTRLALQFLQTFRLLDQAARFDVLAISWPAGAREPLVEHFRDAFEAVGRFQMHS